MRISDWSSDVCSSDLAAVASCADLGSDYKRRMPAIRLFGLPTDINSSFERGAAAGPAAIREALWSDRGNMASELGPEIGPEIGSALDRKSTRLNSSH